MTEENPLTIHAAVLIKVPLSVQEKCAPHPSFGSNSKVIHQQLSGLPPTLFLYAL